MRLYLRVSHSKDHRSQLIRQQYAAIMGGTNGPTVASVSYMCHNVQDWDLDSHLPEDTNNKTRIRFTGHAGLNPEVGLLSRSRGSGSQLQAAAIRSSAPSHPRPLMRRSQFDFYGSFGGKRNSAPIVSIVKRAKVTAKFEHKAHFSSGQGAVSSCSLSAARLILHADRSGSAPLAACTEGIPNSSR